MVNIQVEFLPLCMKGWRKYIPVSWRRRSVMLLQNVTAHHPELGELMGPKGSKTDGSSWPFFVPYTSFGSTFEEGVIHDQAYKLRVLLNKFGGAITVNISRAYADLIWFQLAKPDSIHYKTSFELAEDAPEYAYALLSLIKYLIDSIMPVIGYVGLRLFGWYAWNKHRKNDHRIPPNEIY